MTEKEKKQVEEILLSMNPEERKRYMDSLRYKAQGLTGYPSIDEPWMKNYQPGAREIANNIDKNKSLSDVLIEKFDEHSEIPALKYFNATLSREDFKRLIEKWAKAFREIGVEADEIVPIYGTFFPDICAMILALNQIGAIAYPLKLNESKEDFERETSASKIAIVYDGMWNNFKDVFNDDRFKYVISVSAADGILPPLEQVVRFKSHLDAVKSNSKMPSSKKFLHSKDMMKMADAYRGEYKEPFKKDRLAFINTSSGSTINGSVKGIMVTNEAAVAQLGKCVAAEIPFNYGEKVLMNLPPMASTAMFCLFFLPLYKGMTVINEPRLDANKFYSQILQLKPQVALVSGSLWKKFFRDLQKDSKERGTPNLDFFRMPIVGGEGVTACELESMNEALKFCGSPVTMFSGYGMSEIFSVFSVEKNDVKHREDKSKPVISVGMPLPNAKAGIFDENGNELMYNQRGELYIYDKDTVMKGYFKKPKLTADVLKGEWIHSGDIAEIDEEGNIYIYGRKEDKVTLPNGKDMYLFDIANKIKEDQNVQDVMIFTHPLADGTSYLFAHILFKSNFYDDKNKELELIDKYLDFSFNGEVKIDGYKEHDGAFVISPITTKSDRNAMYNDKENYKKIIDGEEYNVDLIESSEGLQKNITKKGQTKILKKQM